MIPVWRRKPGASAFFFPLDYAARPFDHFLDSQKKNPFDRFVRPPFLTQSCISLKCAESDATDTCSVSRFFAVDRGNVEKHP
jgi:hypothetical protein